MHGEELLGYRFENKGVHRRGGEREGKVVRQVCSRDVGTRSHRALFQDSPQKARFPDGLSRVMHVAFWLFLPLLSLFLHRPLVVVCSCTAPAPLKS